MTFAEWAIAVKGEINEGMEFTHQPVSSNPVLQTEALAKVMVYMAVANEKLASAKNYYRQAYAEATERAIKEYPKASTSQQKALAEGWSSMEKSMCEMIERFSATCVHQIEAYRTLISANKAELRYSNHQGG
jgi:hypothetical protein